MGGLFSSGKKKKKNENDRKKLGKGGTCSILLLLADSTSLRRRDTKTSILSLSNHTLTIHDDRRDHVRGQSEVSTQSSVEKSPFVSEKVGKRNRDE